jgi:23S rRNA (uridine2552-2'-O)-methyltransferase
VPSKWLRQHRRDQFHRLAKEKGFRSRSSFKLLQVAKRYRFIKRGDNVLDVGAAPGGWLQAARQLVGEEGFVLGVDKESIKALPYENVRSIVGDITQGELIDHIQSAFGSRFDVVVSDLAQNVSGVWDVDHARQIDLARHALRVARAVIKPQGNMLVKVFQGSELKDFQSEMKSAFRTLRIVKPPASRPESAELYFLGLEFLG